MEIMRLFLAFLAVYRLAILVSKDNGPMFIFKRIQNYTNRKAGNQLIKGDEYGFWVSLNEGINCALCTGLWMAILCTILVIWPTLAGDIFMTAMALAGGQSLLQKMATK